MAMLEMRVWVSRNEVMSMIPLYGLVLIQKHNTHKKKAYLSTPIAWSKLDKKLQERNDW